MRSEQWRYTVLVKFKKTQVLPADTQSKDFDTNMYLKEFNIYTKLAFEPNYDFFFLDFFTTEYDGTRSWIKRFNTKLRLGLDTDLDGVGETHARHHYPCQGKCYILRKTYNQSVTNDLFSSISVRS